MGKVTYEYPIKDICGKIGKDATVGFAHRGDTKYTGSLRLFSLSGETARQNRQHDND